MPRGAAGEDRHTYSIGYRKSLADTFWTPTLCWLIIKTMDMRELDGELFICLYS